MSEIQNLLNQVSIIVKKNDEIIEATGGRFNMFRILGVDHYENTHSAILAELLNPKGTHGLNDKFLKALFDIVCLKDELRDFDFENAIVKTEYRTENGRIDLIIKDNIHAIIIENKIYAKDQVEQLKKYHESFENIKNKHQIFYLTLFGSKASDRSSGGIDYSQISYSIHIIKWLEKCVSIATRFPLVRETIIQYINHLKKLTDQDMDKKNQEEMIALLARPENIEAAIKISENILPTKVKVLTIMAKKVAEKFNISFKVNQNANSVRFFKENWKDGSGIYFASDKGETYYSLKTSQSFEGKADLQKRIDSLFNFNPDRWNPYGYSHVYNSHWLSENSLLSQIAQGSFADEIIIPNLQLVLNYLKAHPEIEKQL